MSDVLEVIKKITSQPDKVTNVKQHSNKRLFEYDGKYTFSISKAQNPVAIYYFEVYPNASIDDVIAGNIMDHKTVLFSTVTISGATPTFAALYELTSAKLHGIEDIFKDILGEGSAY